MANPRIIAQRHRYIVLAILTAITLAYGYYLVRTYWPAAQQTKQQTEEKFSVPVAVTADGGVRLDGTLYTSPQTLKAKVADIQKAHPGAGFSITAKPGDSLEAVAKAVVLLQQSGAKSVWVLNEPKNTP